MCVSYAFCTAGVRTLAEVLAIVVVKTRMVMCLIFTHIYTAQSFDKFRSPC